MAWNCPSSGAASQNDWGSELQLVSPDTAKLHCPTGHPRWPNTKTRTIPARTFNTISRLSWGMSPCRTWTSAVMALDVARTSASFFVSQKTMARPCEPLYTCRVLTMTDVRSRNGQPMARCCNRSYSQGLKNTTDTVGNAHVRTDHENLWRLAWILFCDSIRLEVTAQWCPSVQI